VRVGAEVLCLLTAAVTKEVVGLEMGDDGSPFDFIHPTLHNARITTGEMAFRVSYKSIIDDPINRYGATSYASPPRSHDRATQVSQQLAVAFYVTSQRRPGAVNSCCKGSSSLGKNENNQTILRKSASCLCPLWDPSPSRRIISGYQEVSGYDRDGEASCGMQGQLTDLKRDINALWKVGRWGIAWRGERGLYR